MVRPPTIGRNFHDSVTWKTTKGGSLLCRDLVPCIEFWLADRNQLAHHGLIKSLPPKTHLTNPRSRTMARTSTTRIFVWSLALVAAAGPALSLGRPPRGRPPGAGAGEGGPAHLPGPPTGQRPRMSGPVPTGPKTLPTAPQNTHPPL